MTDDAERWLPIPWAPAYEVSDCANVRTMVPRGNRREPLAEPRTIATVRILSNEPYAYLPCPDGKYRLRNVRRIMDAVFDGEATP